MILLNVDFGIRILYQFILHSLDIFSRSISSTVTLILAIKVSYFNVSLRISRMVFYWTQDDLESIKQSLDLRWTPCFIIAFDHVTMLCASELLAHHRGLPRLCDINIRRCISTICCIQCANWPLQCHP